MFFVSAEILGRAACGPLLGSFERLEGRLLLLILPAQQTFDQSTRFPLQSFTNLLHFFFGHRFQIGPEESGAAVVAMLLRC